MIAEGGVVVVEGEEKPLTTQKVSTCVALLLAQVGENLTRHRFHYFFYFFFLLFLSAQCGVKVDMSSLMSQ